MSASSEAEERRVGSADVEAPGRIWFGYIAAVGLVVIGAITTDLLAFGLAGVMLVATVLGERYRARVAARLAADRRPDLADLVTRWARGWAFARYFPRPERVAGGVRIEVGEPGRRVEWVAIDEPETLSGLVDTVAATPEAWLSVATADPAGVRPWLLEGGLGSDSQEEALMSIDLVDQVSRDLPDGYAAEIERDGGRITATVRSAGKAGEVAASGRIAVIGADAVVDRIHTEPDHRHRGLGGAMMTVLVAAAREAGATRGILVATEMGEPLYAGLGWQEQARLVIARPATPRTPAESHHQ
ncbi:acetyltransferase (GNAT) family protein [Nocardioides albertanoniae]|uniref:Acetyltransferase (GNAT) family protein n=1 Tax=Nocardioides albertanoniae TaxID=1175486 RepID=A0A543A6H9_9ACTN|nr:GNAT family N-acetyltransferase [Nocardioides albertanoniae]TQL68167.1 acetyltransferase (GNAT) family protein [Nocardioides albertanoniae]